MNRVVAALLTGALLGLVPVTVGVAQAAEAGAARAETAPTATAERGLPKRKINVKIVEPRPNRLFFKGRVTPDFSEKVVTVQKKGCKTKKCKWVKYKKVRTNEKGVFKTRVPAPRRGKLYWRAMTPKTDNYAKTVSDVWYTYTI